MTFISVEMGDDLWHLAHLYICAQIKGRDPNIMRSLLLIMFFLLCDSFVGHGFEAIYPDVIIY